MKFQAAICVVVLVVVMYCSEITAQDTRPHCLFGENVCNETECCAFLTGRCNKLKEKHEACGGFFNCIRRGGCGRGLVCRINLIRGENRPRGLFVCQEP